MIGGLDENLQEWKIIKSEIPSDAIATELLIKKKLQVNPLGKSLGIDHAFGVVKLQKMVQSRLNTYYALCDHGMKTLIVQINSQDALNIGQLLKTVKIQKDISYQKLLKIKSEFKHEYDLLDNNCSHFIQYLQSNLQEGDDKPLEMEQFTNQQLGKGLFKLFEIGVQYLEEQQQTHNQKQQNNNSLNNSNKNNQKNINNNNEKNGEWKANNQYRYK